MEGICDILTAVHSHDVAVFNYLCTMVPNYNDYGTDNVSGGKQCRDNDIMCCVMTMDTVGMVT